MNINIRYLLDMSRIYNTRHFSEHRSDMLYAYTRCNQFD